MKLSEAVTVFLQAKTAAARSARTLEKYQQHLEALTLALNDPPLAAITDDHLSAFLAAKRPHLKPSSLATYFRTYRTFFGWATRKYHLPTNPILLLDAPRVPARLPASAPAADLIALLKTAESARHREQTRAVLLLLIGTGIRAGELCALKREECDLDALTIRVMGKDARERLIPIEPEIAAALRTAWEHAPTSPWAVTSYRTHGRYTVSGIRGLLKRLARRAGITRRMYPHLLRHTYAHEWLVAGGDLSTLMRAMGHSNLTTTQRYTNTVIEDVKATHARVRPLGRLGKTR